MERLNKADSGMAGERDSLLTHCDTRESVQSAKCTLSGIKIDNAVRAVTSVSRNVDQLNHCGKTASPF